MIDSSHPLVMEVAILWAAGAGSAGFMAALATYWRSLKNSRLLEGDDDLGRDGVVERVDRNEERSRRNERALRHAGHDPSDHNGGH